MALRRIPSFKALLSYKHFIFDCDGVLWHGDKELFSSFDIIRLLQSKGKSFFLYTNDSTKTQTQGAAYAEKLAGFRLDARRFFSSAHLVARFARERKYRRVYVIGGEALFEELSLALPDARLIGKGDSKKMGLDDKLFVKREENVDAVAVAWDHELNYYKLAYAIDAVDKGADLVACHGNLTYRTKGVLLPNTGITVGAIEAATNRKAIVVGKPSHYGIELICKAFRINFEEERKNMLIVGDTLGVEIKMGNELGIDSLLVLSGRTSKEMLEQSAVTPTYVLPYLTYEE